VEITLRGRVLAVGGVKEKVLSAHRAGIFTIILPAENGKDVEEIPVNVLDNMEMLFVDHVDEVLECALRKDVMACETPVTEDIPEIPAVTPAHEGNSGKMNYTAVDMGKRPPKTS